VNTQAPPPGDQEIIELARLLRGPGERDLPAARRQILKEHLVREFSRPDADERAGATPGLVRRARARPRLAPARRSKRRLALLACATAAAAMAASVVLVALNTSAPQRHSGQAAAQLLAKIAFAAGRQPAPHARSGQYSYIVSKVSFQVDDGGHVYMEKPHQREIWISVSDLCRTGLLRERGQDIPLNGPTGGVEISGAGAPHPAGCPDKGSVNNPTYRLLQSLPTNPRSLLNLIYAKTRGGGAATGHDQEAFITIGDLLRESIPPPEVSAALYRAAALIPGVTVVRDAADAIGRHGVAVARTDNNGTRSEWIFDRASLRMIGEREVDLATGSVTGTTAILARAFTDRVGQLPHKAGG